VVDIDQAVGELGKRGVRVGTFYADDTFKAKTNSGALPLDRGECGRHLSEIGKRAYRVKLALAEPNRPEFLINTRGIADYSRRLAERIDGPRILPAPRVGSVFGSAARFAYYPSRLRVTCSAN
jgi:hypothetical protein